MNFNAAYGAMREHTTPIPTPPWVRLGSSILIGAAVALLASRAHIFAALVGALVCLVAAFVLVFAHPYRRAMRRRFRRKLYGQRWHAESGFSQHKRRLGSALTARREDAQVRELALRVATHNLMHLAATP